MTDDLTSDETLGLLVDLTGSPEGSIPTDAVVLVSYHDPDGDAAMGMATFGEALITSRLGLLAWAQYQLAANQEED